MMCGPHKRITPAIRVANGYAYRYDFGMKRTTKVAVSIPDPVFDDVEATRKRLGQTRSAAVTEALIAWLRVHGADDADQRYAEAYLRRPEPTDELAGVAAGAAGAWEPWESETE